MDLEETAQQLELLQSTVAPTGLPTGFQATTLPRPFGAYMLLTEIARGGQGAVFRARHTDLGRTVALKILLSQSPQARRRFRREARVLARLQHPNVIGVSDLGEIEGTPYLAMDHVEGQDLRCLFRGRFPALDWTTQTLAPIARALHYCHGQGVLHRDVKPANVLIEEGTGRPVLVDFGVVRRDPQTMIMSTMDEVRVSQSGATVGTPSFMAPEQAGATDEATPRTDVYGSC